MNHKKDFFLSIIEEGVNAGINELGNTLDSIFHSASTKSTPHNASRLRSAPQQTDFYSILCVAEKLLLGGKSEINPNRFQTAEAAQYRSTVFEPTLVSLESTSKTAESMEQAYKQAGIILRGYYAADKISSFINDLISTWQEDLIDEDPELYAKELYNNSLRNIRFLFQRMNEKLSEENFPMKAGSSLTSSERRLAALNQYHFPNTNLTEMVQATIEARSLANQLLKEMDRKQINQSPDFSQAAKKLRALFLNEKGKITREKLESYANAVQHVIESEQQRFEHLQPDIDRAQKLHARLSAALDTEEQILLLDSLNPKNGQLEGKTSAEIHEQYRPFIEQLEKINEEFAQ